MHVLADISRRVTYNDTGLVPGTSGETKSSRRRFLKQLSVGVAGLGLFPAIAVGSHDAGVSDRKASLEPTSNPQNVVVIGAGLAGLAAAWESEEAGHDVTVLEAKSRPGGRVQTIREPFDGDLYAEAGAVAFSEGYAVAMGSIDALGLERAPWARSDLPSLYYLKGNRFTAGGDHQPDWPYDLTEEEQALGPMGIVKKYLFSTLPKEISTPDTWNEPPLVRLDQMSLGEYMREQGASEGAVALIRDTQWFGPAVKRGSALSSAVADFGLFMGGAPFLLKGGNDRLPAAMAEELSGNVQYGVEVTSLRDAGQSVEVQADRLGRNATFAADRVVCTVPAPALRRLEVEPRMPQDKRSALSEISYLEATRTFVQTRRAFWHDEGVSGRAATDLSIGTIDRHPYARAPGPKERAVLEAYANGPAASRLAALPDSELVPQVLSEMERVHPKVREHAEGAVVKTWSRGEGGAGHVSWPAPGEVTAHLTALQAPHGRIHFAGEHTSILRSTMEGALRSGIRAAKEVNTAD